MQRANVMVQHEYNHGSTCRVVKVTYNDPADAPGGVVTRLDVVSEISKATILATATVSS